MSSPSRHSVAVALALALGASPARAAPLTLRFLDVGQGDAALLSHGGQHLLIDTGPTDAIVAQLSGLGVTGLDLLLISHNHADHLGGADAILEALPVREYVDNGVPAATKIQQLILSLLSTHGVPHLEVRGPLVYGDLTLRPLPEVGDVGGDLQNNASIGLVVEHGRFRALFTGDSEVEAINVWLARQLIGDVDVLKAAHHGSRNGVTPLWLHRSKPELVVVSVGAGNDYGHPHEGALRYYQAGGRRLLRTDKDGSVVITVDDAGAYTVTLPDGAAKAAATAKASKEVQTNATAPKAAPGKAAANTVEPAPASGATPCCAVCKSGKACGNACIPREHECTRPKGCACDAPQAEH